MKAYVVAASFVTHCQMVIEAENEDDAWAQAQNLDGGSFDPHGYGDWSIDDVVLLGETA